MVLIVCTQLPQDQAEALVIIYCRGPNSGPDLQLSLLFPYGHPPVSPQTSPAGVNIVGSSSALVAFTRQTRTPLGRGEQILVEQNCGRT
jgi:hypothetical protein